MGAGWYWSLPADFQSKPEWLEAVGESEDAREDAQDAQRSKQGILGTFGESSEDQPSNVVPFKPGPKEVF